MTDAGSSKTKIYLYKGLGCSEEASQMLQTSLNRHVDLSRHDVEPITPERIISGTWTPDAALVVFGGGFDLGFIEALGDKGIQCIRDFVWKQGGAYLGLCAGAYFACDSIEFDKAGPLAVCGERHLKFYPGRCIGPAYPGFDYKSRKGAVAAPTDFSSYEPWKDALGVISVYTDGGGYFTNQTENGDTPVANGGPEHTVSSNGLSNGSSGDIPKVDVLARFQDLPDCPAAIVKCSVGGNGGKAILSGVHFEYSSDKLIPGENSLLDSVVTKVTASDKGRQLLLISVLKDLGVHTAS